MAAKKKAPERESRWGVYDVYYANWMVDHDGAGSEWTKDPKRAWAGNEAEARGTAKAIARGPRQFGGLGEQCVAQRLPE